MGPMLSIVGGIVVGYCLASGRSAKDIEVWFGFLGVTVIVIAQHI